MSFLVTPILNYTVHFAISSVGTVINYTAKGAWYITKRAIWGIQPTPEQVLAHQLEKIEHNEEEILHRQSEFEEEQKKIITALETQLQQQAEIIKHFAQTELN